MTRFLRALPSHYLALTVLPAIFLYVFVMVRSYLACFVMTTWEGGPAEVGTVIALLIGAQLAFLNVHDTGLRREKVFFALVGVAFLLFALEELSYGQRILGIETPEFFNENSRQNEINLHNLLEGLSGEEFDTLIFLRDMTWALGIIAPLVVKKGRIPLPSLFLVPGFFCAAQLMHSYVHGNEREYGELLVSIGLVLFMLMEWQQRKGREFRLTVRGVGLSALALLIVVPGAIVAASAQCEAEYCTGQPVVERLRAEVDADTAVISLQDPESYLRFFTSCRLESPNVYRAFYLDPNPEPVREMLNHVLANYDEVYAIYVNPDTYDPERVVQSRLLDGAFEANSTYYDFIQVVQYGIAHEMSAPTSVNAVFGERITLRDYALDTEPLDAGDVLEVALTWETDDALDVNYVVGVYLLDAGGVLVADHNGMPRANTSLTSTWTPGETITDQHGIALPADLPPGEYGLHVALFSDAGRLPVGETDLLYLTNVTVTG